MRIFVAFLLLIFLPCVVSFGQSSRPSIYLDCQMRCYLNYVKEQIDFVDYMQNRQEADIYILATRQRTGAGGNEIQLAFEGNNELNGMLDTIKYVIDPNATESIERDQLVSELKKGLLKYLVNTNLIEDIDYSVSSSNEPATDISNVDPWNYWVFNIGGNGWLNGEDSYSNIDLTSRISANRITDKHKIEFSARYNYDKDNFTLSDGEKFENTSETYSLYLEYVKSINDHWSVGGISRSGSSTFGNTDVSTTIKAAVEFNVYPYSESQTRRFSFFYAIGPEYYDYADLTIYDKLNEWVSRHGLTLTYEQTQKWGDIYISFGVEQYFHDPELYNAYLNPRIEWQIFKGLSIDFGGFFSFVNDRINIAKSDITDEDILLQIKQLDTDFYYYSYFGINYRFGSKYNNFVNPRF